MSDIPIIGEGKEVEPEENVEIEQDLPTPQLGSIIMPTNDEGLAAVEIIGRCSVCSITGTMEYPKNQIPVRDVDRIMSYKPVTCFCPKCKKTTTFCPIDVKLYKDVGGLEGIQKGFKKGIVS
tara:strand:+ start:149 stop:514 length:366 start_codon:yes stop_codon:yes gene_type:complete